MSKGKLKPCPWCKGEAEYKSVPIADTGDYDFLIWCNNKNCLIKPEFWCDKYTEQNAIKAWNTRPIEDELEEYKFMYEGLYKFMYKGLE